MSHNVYYAHLVSSRYGKSFIKVVSSEEPFTVAGRKRDVHLSEYTPVDTLGTLNETNGKQGTTDALSGGHRQTCTSESLLTNRTTNHHSRKVEIWKSMLASMVMSASDGASSETAEVIKLVANAA